MEEIFLPLLGIIIERLWLIRVSVSMCPLQYLSLGNALDFRLNNWSVYQQMNVIIMHAYTFSLPCYD